MKQELTLVKYNVLPNEVAAINEIQEELSKDYDVSIVILDGAEKVHLPNIAIFDGVNLVDFHGYGLALDYSGSIAMESCPMTKKLFMPIGNAISLTGSAIEQVSTIQEVKEKCQKQ